MPLLRGEQNYPILNIRVEQDFFRDGDWEELLAACDGILLRKDLEKLQNALQSSCKTIIIERSYYCKDYRDTYTNFYAKKFADYPSKAVRLFFFKVDIDPTKWWDVNSYKEGFIGYSVIRPTLVTSIGRTILDPTACKGVHGHMCLTWFDAHLFGVELKVLGFPYISQDSDVTICAHAACWMCFRYLSERYTNFGEIYPFQITQLTHDLSHGRLVPSTGLEMSQVTEIFANYGLSPKIYSREVFEGSFLRLLFEYIDSGIPIVIGLEKPGHAVVAIGHILDFRTKPQDPGIVWSSSYVSGLVVNDDNSMPYQIVPGRGTEHTGHISSHFTLDQIDSFVVPLHDKVHLVAEDVEDLTFRVLLDPRHGMKKLSPLLKAYDDVNEIVIRQYLTTSRAYREERCKPGRKPPNNLDRFYSIYPMPRFIWVSELSTKSLFEDSQQILGEILWDATAQRHQFAFLLIHYPEVLLANDPNLLQGGKHIRDMISLPSSQPYPAYRHNLEEIHDAHNY